MMQGVSAPTTLVQVTLLVNDDNLEKEMLGKCDVHPTKSGRTRKIGLPWWSTVGVHEAN